MAEHTPGPWFVAHDAVWVQNPILQRTPTMVAQCAINGVAEDQQEANAEFIVRACNSHDELLAALEVVTHALEHQRMVDQSHEDVVALGQARAAIAKAKGG